MSITLNGTTGITTPDIDSVAAPDFDGSNITGIATAAQGVLADTALQPALAGVTSVDDTTVATFSAAGVGGGGTHDFVASGSIPNGALVGITLDGKAKVVSPLTGFDDYNGTTSNFNKVVYDTNSNKVVVVYTSGGSNWTKAIVGTVNGTSITFGSEATIVNQISYNHSVAFDSNSNKVVVALGNASLDTSVAYVGTVSGTSISFGSSSQFYNIFVHQTAMVFDSNSNKIVLGYRYGNNIYAKVGTVSGTSISFGGQVQMSQSNTRDLTTAAFDSTNNKVVFVYRNSSTDEGVARVGTVSGTSISFGTTTSFDTNGYYPRVAFDSNVNKLFVSYGKSNDSYRGYVVVGTVSGTSISFGTPVQYMTAHNISEDTHDVTYDPVSQKPIIMYMESNTWYVLVGTISGTSISFLPVVEGAFSYDTYMDITYDPDEDRLIIVGRSPQYGGAANVVDTTSVMSSFIGLADEAISDGSTGKVTINGGVNSSQSNLDIAATYYLSADGNLTKTATGSIATVGTALSDTEMLKL